jgi:hypothetical protein
VAGQISSPHPSTMSDEELAAIARNGCSAKLVWRSTRQLKSSSNEDPSGLLIGRGIRALSRRPQRKATTSKLLALSGHIQCADQMSACGGKRTLITKFAICEYTP